MDILSALLHPKHYIQAVANHQRSILDIMAVLPGQHRYKAVDAAVKAADVKPGDVYTSLVVGETTAALILFYRALEVEEKR